LFRKPHIVLGVGHVNVAVGVALAAACGAAAAPPLLVLRYRL